MIKITFLQDEALEYTFTPFLQRVKDALVARLSKMPTKFSLSQLLSAWEMSVRAGMVTNPQFSLFLLFESIIFFNIRKYVSILNLSFLHARQKSRSGAHGLIGKIDLYHVEGVLRAIVP